MITDDEDDIEFGFEPEDDGEEGIISFAVPDAVKDDLRRISPDELRALGVSVVAYIRPGKKDGADIYEVCAADGTVMSVVRDYNNAVTSIWNNDLCAVRVH